MSKSYWLLIVAVLSFLAGSVPAQPANRDAGGNIAFKKSPPEPKTYAPPSIPASIQNDIHNIANALEAANDRKPSDTDLRNTKAQEEVARWTPWLFGMGSLELMITATGVWLVYRTLIYSRDAVKAAIDSVNEAEKATKATREIGEAQVRAYLACEGGEFRVLGGWIDCRPTIRNFGQSPARNVKIEAKLYILGVGNSGHSFVGQTNVSATHVSGNSIANCAIIASGTPLSSYLHWQQNGALTPSHLVLFQQGVQVSITGFIGWDDVFGKTHRIDFTLIETAGASIAGPAPALRHGPLELSPNPMILS